MKVTLKQIKDANACREGYRKLAEYVRDNGIEKSFCPSVVLKSNNISDTLWGLRWVCGDEGIKICRKFAINCALRALPIFENEYPDDKRPREAIEAAQQYVDGEITIKQLQEKLYAVDAADAAYAADCAAYAVCAAYASKKEIAWQEEKLEQMIKNSQ